GARRAIELGASVILLDDGFQHRRLARDLDIVMLDGADPFLGGHLLPRGRLREPPSALSRAHLAVLVGEGAPLRAATPALRVRASAIAPDLRGRRVALLAAIARPERFTATVRQLGAEIVLTRYF